MDHLVVYENIKQLVTLSGVAKKKGRHPKAEDLGIIENASMVVNTENNQIEWVGQSLPPEFQKIVNRFSCEGEIWIPELIECHTHLVYAGHRHADYAKRCAGISYQAIAEAGGGILSTVKATREASLEELVESARHELERFQKFGVGVLEIKSGYGLDLETELKILDCIQNLSEQSSVQLFPTFLPAHAIPPEFKGRSEDYVGLICKEWIPEVSRQGLARFFDAFVETGYFSAKQSRKMAETAKDCGLKIKLHTDQFTDVGGVEMGIEVGAISLDHLDQVSEKSIQRIADSDSVAVLCPGASLFTKTPYAPARKLIDAGAAVALSTDYNPGTCPSRNLPLMTTIACSAMQMTIPESLAAVTYNAAQALGIEKITGSLEAGKEFRVLHLSGDSYEILPYCFGEFE